MLKRGERGEGGGVGWEGGGGGGGVFFFKGGGGLGGWAGKEDKEERQ